MFVYILVYVYGSVVCGLYLKCLTAVGWHDTPPPRAGSSVKTHVEQTPPHDGWRCSFVSHLWYIYIYMALYPFVTSRCQNVQPYNISTSIEWQREMCMWWFSLGCCVGFSMIGVKMHTVWRNSVFAYITIIRKIYIYILRQKLRPPLFLNNLETHIFDSENLTVEKIHTTHSKQEFSKRNDLNGS